MLQKICGVLKLSDEEENTKYDKKTLNIRLETHIHGTDTVYLNLPKIFCNKFGITGEEGEEVSLIIHQVIKNYKARDLCDIKFKK